MSRDTLTPEQRGLLLDAVQDTVRDTAAPGHVDDLREALAARGLAVVPVGDGEGIEAAARQYYADVIAYGAEEADLYPLQLAIESSVRPERDGARVAAEIRRFIEAMPQWIAVCQPNDGFAPDAKEVGPMLHGDLVRRSDVLDEIDRLTAIQEGGSHGE